MSKIKLNAASGGGSVSLEAPTSTTGNANVEFKLPVADGSSGQALTTNASGQLAFATVSTAIQTTSGTDNFTVADGNLVIGTDGHGIDFSDSSHASGMTNELLDDYEEGTWTPILNASSYSVSNDMFYTKIGRVVFVSGSLEFTSITGGSGTIEITGLPYTNINSNDAFTTISAHAYESLNVGNTSYQFQTLRIQKGSATLRIIIPTGNAGVRTFGNYSHVGNSRFNFRVAGFYITA